MKVRSVRPILESVQAVALGSESNIDQLADLLGIATSTLYARLNPFDQDKHLTVTQLLRILDNSDPLQALKALADRFGYEITPAVCPIPDKTSIEAECLDDHPSLVAAHQAYLVGDVQAGHAHMAAHIEECRQTSSKAEQGAYRPHSDGPGQKLVNGRWARVDQ